MSDQYDFLRDLYNQILDHCEYVLNNSGDAVIRAKAEESKHLAERELTRLSHLAQSAAEPSTTAQD